MNELTIIIPTYNRLAYLQECLYSLEDLSMCANIIIVDNNSSDGTQEYCENLVGYESLTYHRHDTNIGMVNNWLFAVQRLCQTEFAMILSDDDLISDPKIIYDSLALLKNNKNLALVHSNQVIIDENGLTIQKNLKVLPPIISGTSFLRDFMKNRNFTLNLSNVVFRVDKNIFGMALSNQNIMSVDFVYFLLLSHDKEIGYIPKYSSKYRVHRWNESKLDFDKWLYNANFIDLVVSYLNNNTCLDAKDITRLTKRLRRRYARTRLIPRLLRVFSLRNFLKYAQWAVKVNQESLLIEVLNPRSICAWILNK